MEIPDHTNQKFLVLEIKHRASDMLGKPSTAEQYTSPSFVCVCVCVCVYVRTYVLKMTFDGFCSRRAPCTHSLELPSVLGKISNGLAKCLSR